MTPQLTQKELSDYYSNGDTSILQFRDMYEIKYCHGISGYIMQKVGHIYTGLPFTKRGRFVAMPINSAFDLIG